MECHSTPIPSLVPPEEAGDVKTRPEGPLPFVVNKFDNFWLTNKKYRLAVAYITRSEMGPTAHTLGAVGACMRLLREFPEVDVQLFADSHHLDIAAKRCILANDAFDSGCHALIMIDDDMALKPTSLVPLVQAWLKGKKVVAAPYFGKERFGNSMCTDIFHDPVTFPDPFEEPIEVHMAGTGVILIDMAVVEKFLELGLPLFLADHTTRGDLTATEDYYFTELANSLGFSIWVVPPVIPHVRYFQSYDGTAPADEVTKPGILGYLKVTVAGAVRTLDSMTLPELVLLLTNCAPTQKIHVLAELNKRRVFSMGEVKGCRGIR